MLPPRTAWNMGKCKMRRGLAARRRMEQHKAPREDLLPLLDPLVPAPPFPPTWLLPRIKASCYLSCANQQCFVMAVLAPKAALPPGHREQRDVGAPSVQHRSMNRNDVPARQGKPQPPEARGA